MKIRNLECDQIDLNDPAFVNTLDVTLKKIINQSKTTAILVTHDEVEAKRLSDKCFILENGKLKSV